VEPPRRRSLTMHTPPSPFVGLSAFTRRMSPYFTGRERFALTLSGAVLRSRITVLYGRAGAGKSSVFGAALPQSFTSVLPPFLHADRSFPFRMLPFQRWHLGFEDRLYRASR